jgi:hypothetical protein
MSNQILRLERYPEYLGTTPGDIWLGDRRICHTLELPWRDNRVNVSCIPLGTYGLAITHSPRFKKPLPLVAGVPKRSGIRMHAANEVSELQGCIAIATGLSIVNGKVIGLMSKKMLEDVMLIIDHYKIHSLEIIEKKL